MLAAGVGMQPVARVVFSFVAIQGLWVGVAWACKCQIDTRSTAERLEAHDQVFVGTVVSSRPGCGGALGTVSSTDPVLVSMEVTAAFKGVAGGELVELSTVADDSSCGVEFEVGESWLIYTNDGSVGLCDPGGRANAMAEEIAELEALSE